MQINVPIRKILTGACVPAYSHGPAEDAGVDLVYCGTEEVRMKPGSRHAFSTGLAIELPSGYEGQVRPRSGLARKKGITVLNSPGTIDPGYRGEIQVLLINLDQEEQVILPGERIAQLIVAPYAAVSFVLSEALSDTTRGEGGFGSTGTH